MLVRWPTSWEKIFALRKIYILAETQGLHTKEAEALEENRLMKKSKGRKDYLPSPAEGNRPGQDPRAGGARRKADGTIVVAAGNDGRI